MQVCFASGYIINKLALSLLTIACYMNGPDLQFENLSWPDTSRCKRTIKLPAVKRTHLGVDAACRILSSSSSHLKNINTTCILESAL